VVARRVGVHRAHDPTSDMVKIIVSATIPPFLTFRDQQMRSIQAKSNWWLASM